MAVAYIIEGDLEKLFIEKVCGGVPVRKIGLNGRGAQIPAMVKNIATLLRLFKGRYFPVVIVFDREKRVEPSEQIENEVLTQLRALGFDEEIIVAVPDQMIENWICAGTRAYQGGVIPRLADLVDCDGRPGKGLLKAGLDEIGTIYGETTVGVEMLSTIHLQSARARSASFNRLYLKARGFCPWLKRLSEEE